MYDSYMIASRIKETAKKKKISLKKMLTECQLGINTVSQLSKGTDMYSKNLARIADYLDCSVDYLLGRTNEITEARDIFDVLNTQEKYLIQRFRETTEEGRFDIIASVVEITKRIEKNAGSEDSSRIG